MEETSISRHWIRPENSIQSESNLEPDENWTTTPQGSQACVFFEKLLSSAETEMYNHIKVFYQIYRLRISELKGTLKMREFNSYTL